MDHFHYHISNRPEIDIGLIWMTLYYVRSLNSVNHNVNCIYNHVTLTHPKNYTNRVRPIFHKSATFGVKYYIKEEKATPISPCFIIDGIVRSSPNLEKKKDIKLITENYISNSRCTVLTKLILYYAKFFHCIQCCRSKESTKLWKTPSIRKLHCPILFEYFQLCTGFRWIQIH